jgi:hypothetical protein
MGPVMTVSMRRASVFFDAGSVQRGSDMFDDSRRKGDHLAVNELREPQERPRTVAWTIAIAVGICVIGMPIGDAMVCLLWRKPSPWRYWPLMESLRGLPVAILFAAFVYAVLRVHGTKRPMIAVVLGTVIGWLLALAHAMTVIAGR